MDKNINNLYLQAMIFPVLIVTTIGMYIEYGFKMSALYLVAASILATIIYIPINHNNKNNNTEELN